MELCMHEKAVFFQYTHGVVCRLSWPHDALPCVLIGASTVNINRDFLNEEWMA